MVRIRTKGSIFDSGAEALVDPVDCTGAQGAGLAKEFARRYRRTCDDFRRRARAGKVPIGSVFVGEATSGTSIIFLPTKRHFSEPAQLSFVVDGLHALVAEASSRRHGQFPWRTIAIPALGCGLGGLAWEDVRVEEEAAAARIEAFGIDVILYAPHRERERP